MLVQNAKSIFIYVRKYVSGFIWKLGINIAVCIKWIDKTRRNNRLLLVPNCYEVVAMVATMVVMVAPLWLSGVPDYFDRNKILSGYDLSHYQVPHCIKSFLLFCLMCLFITIFNFILNYVPIVTFWIFTCHKIWILLIIFCCIWNYWIIYFVTCLEVFWSVVS